MRSFSITSIFLLVALCGFGQTTRNSVIAGPTTIVNGTLSGTIPSSGFVSSDGNLTSTFYLSSDGNLRYASGNNWVAKETRKDDGHGPTLAMVHKAAHAVDSSRMAPLQYVSMARSIGAVVQADEAELLAAIHEANLETYDFTMVDNYLYRQALKQGAEMRWVWKPVAEKDVEPLTKANTWRVEPNVGIVFPKTYSQKIPFRALVEMGLVLDKMPDAIFLVSDYEVVKPDPFLAVTTLKLLVANKVWIVDQWDEPTFGSDVTLTNLKTASLQ